MKDNFKEFTGVLSYRTYKSIVRSWVLAKVNGMATRWFQAVEFYNFFHIFKKEDFSYLQKIQEQVKKKKE